MTDPYRLWHEAMGQAKERTIRRLWPELAEALDGTSAGDTQTPAELQPLCRNCGDGSGKLAICRAGEIPVCGLCAGLAEFRAMKIVRVSQWHAGRRR